MGAVTARQAKSHGAPPGPAGAPESLPVIPGGLFSCLRYDAVTRLN